jgi:hypothetical protein
MKFLFFFSFFFGSVSISFLTFMPKILSPGLLYLIII